MKNSDDVAKLDTMINDGIMKSIYAETTDNTLKELSQFQDFLYRNFHNGTAETHRFETLEDLTVANVQFWPIIDQTGTFTYKAAKVISDYLRPLCKNEYPIKDTQKNPSMLSSISPLQDDEEDISYDIESLLTNILIEQTINYIIEQIYVHKRLTPICSKLILRRLLIKLAPECTFKFNSRFLKTSGWLHYGRTTICYF